MRRQKENLPKNQGGVNFIYLDTNISESHCARRANDKTNLYRNKLYEIIP